MPELPEVETIRQGLSHVLVGTKIVRVEVRLPKMVSIGSSLPSQYRTNRRDRAQHFVQMLRGRKVQRIERRAKLLLIELSGKWYLVVHLKMSGQLVWRPRSGRLLVGGHPIPGGTELLPNRYTRVVVTTTHGQLFFNDQRQFGYMKIIGGVQLSEWMEAHRFGPEPLDPHFQFSHFRRILRKHQAKRIKPTLLDQTVIAGVGNIYADETCFDARVRPTRRIRTLTKREQQRLFRGLRRVLRAAVRHRGTTARFFRTVTGEKGRMNRFLRVYGRAGRSCRRGDGGVIKKIVLQGRGTHFCPVCQPR
ncbi:MAG: bifunctional DNA-formamidopyrimidine glycosylase/DNA-(apurinic or apyrimidinic site) lyase [Candidatus Kerfeldbacteria bacterium]|nr:bifunctional DNA-formamidopyrimidine glycosylase/DNA-(apurinic or apyrimidinic site) lyase [Candidatus Kerfeldbacteria bacterium]